MDAGLQSFHHSKVTSILEPLNKRYNNPAQRNMSATNVSTTSVKEEISLH